MTSPRIVVSYGMGVDSTAMMLRWIAEPATRPGLLEEMLVVTAMTGDEYPRTGELVERYILPLFRQHSIRYAQVSRPGKSAGFTVLEDSRCPERVHLYDGPWSLSAEMQAAGTVPQVGGSRLCSVHAKGEVIDPFVAKEVAGPYLHVLGFEAEEAGRARKDAKYNTKLRTGAYPLIEWGWDRGDCTDYIRSATGEEWPKSACYFCPFSLTSKEGPDRALDLYAGRPQAAVDALLMEFTARSLNPRQGLAGEKRFLVDLLAHDPRQGGALDVFARRLDEADWQLYEVRRAYVHAKYKPRSLRSLGLGGRAEMAAALRREAAARKAALESFDGIKRAWVMRRSDGYPAAEHLLVAAPAGVEIKTRDGFEAAWSKALAGQAAALF